MFVLMRLLGKKSDPRVERSPVSGYIPKFGVHVIDRMNDINIEI